MAKTSLSEQPLVVRAAVFVTFFNSWVMFEEFVIERVGLWHYMPLYRVGMFCSGMSLRWRQSAWAFFSARTGPVQLLTDGKHTAEWAE
jgi:hypothetical protein